MNTQSYWLPSPIRSFDELQTDLTVDALIVGGGITGLSTAHLLAAAGLRVARVERGLTYMTDTRLSDLVRRAGKKAARIAWQAGDASMEFLRQTVDSLGLDCGFSIVPGYLATDAAGKVEEESRRLKEEEKLAREMGFDVAYVERDPVNGLPALHFPEQMKFHPRKYLAGLLAEALRNGAMVYEHTEVSEFGDGHVIANGRKISYGHVVIATHVPLQGESGTFGAALFQTKLSLYSTYAVSATLPPGEREEMIWSDTAEPFHYLRIDRHEGHDLAIIGGRGLQDRSAIRHPGMLPSPRRKNRHPASRREGEPPLVGPGRRDGRRTALHRPIGRAAIHRQRILRQWHDLRHRRGLDGA